HGRLAQLRARCAAILRRPLCRRSGPHGVPGNAAASRRDATEAVCPLEGCAPRHRQESRRRLQRPSRHRRPEPCRPGGTHEPRRGHAETAHRRSRRRAPGLCRALCRLGAGAACVAVAGAPDDGACRRPEAARFGSDGGSAATVSSTCALTVSERILAKPACLPQRGAGCFTGLALNAPVRLKALPRYASIADAVAAEKPGLPLYLLHPRRFRAVAERFAAFPGDALYAVKANPSLYALEQVWDAGIRHFDTASLGEIELVKSRFPDAYCHFMTPVRLPGAAKIAFEKYGVTDYVVDCDFELDKLLAETGGAKTLRIFVRIATPLGGAILELSSKFGTPPAEAAKLLKRVAKTGAAPAVTFHVGSQCLSPFSYAQAIEMARRTATLAKVELQAMDVGGGFPGPYTGNDVPPYH